jgi:hypothetical protein
MGVISEKTFKDLVAVRASSLLQLSRYLSQDAASTVILTRPLLGDLLSQSTQLEELLDAYGAQNNQQWFRFRAITAAIKLFANVSYLLLHIKHVLPSYSLLEIEHDLVAATNQTLAFTSDVLSAAAAGLWDQGSKLDLPFSPDKYGKSDYKEKLPTGQLPRDRATRKTESASSTVTQMATAFLNLAAQSDLLRTAARTAPDGYAACFPDPISEESLRYLQNRFHSLQALYDTHVSNTEVESVDVELRVLRGHISVIFHLIQTATEFAHYYERHVNIETLGAGWEGPAVVKPEILLTALMEYSIFYAGEYLACGQQLCRELLKRYAEADLIELPIPPCRGFHVRPATLVAKIVLHYGSEVHMELDGDRYDASSPLELFRVNEKINSQKRRWLATQISPLLSERIDVDELDVKTAVMGTVFKLAEQNKLIIYEQPLKLSEKLEEAKGGLLELVTSEIAQLQATEQIDINVDLTTTFIGDKRVLADISLLAKCGYGEDRFGNNVALPQGLSYLRALPT